MQRIDLFMHERLVEEIHRLTDNDLQLSQKLGSRSNIVGGWIHQMCMPNAWYLGALYRQGVDVIYILTGERTRNDKTGSKNHC